MHFGRRLRGLAVAGPLVLGLFATAPVPVAAASEDNYIVLYGSSSQVQEDQVRATGATVTAKLGEAGLLGVRTSHPSALQQLPGVVGVAKDRMRFSIPKEQVVPFNEQHSDSSGCASTQASCPLQWDLARIHVADAWNTTKGSAEVKVAVLDTGLTSTHEEVGANYDIAESRSFVQPTSDCPLDTTTKSRSIEDFYGHGTWTGTHVAGVNGALMTGIAPKATLVNIRVLGACGLGADSWVMEGMLYGSKIGAQVESMSLGGFLCGHGVVKGSVYCDPTYPFIAEDQLLWKAYKQLISHMLDRGTVVVAAAGNDHAQLDATGQVVSHGTLADVTIGYDPLNDFFGVTEAPGGVPGVVAVAALNRVTAKAASADETLFGQYGVGRKDQLSYYSNYGQRIDVSAPGGARNYNVPAFDCAPATTTGGANCRRLEPSSLTATDNPGDFGAWGVDANGAPCKDCYIFVQGTSMATPQVAGVAVLALSANPNLSAKKLVELLKRSVSPFANANATPPIETNPLKPTWNYSMAYGRPGIRNSWMGRGVIDAALAVGRSSNQGGGGGNQGGGGGNQGGGGGNQG
jgi:subtilisin family serine protease